MIPASPGTYVLILEATRSRCVRVGALGELWLEPGFYAYVGSALGPGGLAARIGHHRRRARSPHWHIDYLRRHTALREAWGVSDATAREHEWARLLERGRGVHIPLPRFGASDCRCPSHLFRYASAPDLAAFRRRARSAKGAASGAVERWIR